MTITNTDDVRQEVIIFSNLIYMIPEKGLANQMKRKLIPY